MTFSDRLARFNRWLPNRIVRTFAGRRFSPVAIVEHAGRRSGRRYRTPVLAFPLDDGYVISLPYGPTGTGSGTCWRLGPARCSEMDGGSS